MIVDSLLPKFQQLFRQRLYFRALFTFEDNIFVSSRVLLMDGPIGKAKIPWSDSPGPQDFLARNWVSLGYFTDRRLVLVVGCLQVVPVRLRAILGHLAADPVLQLLCPLVAVAVAERRRAHERVDGPRSIHDGGGVGDDVDDPWNGMATVSV